MILTYHVNKHAYLADQIKRLYKVKASSVADFSKIDKGNRTATAEHISKLHQKVEGLRVQKIHAHILAWRQIDYKDVMNILSTLVNRQKLSLKSLFQPLVSCCQTFCLKHRNADHLKR